MKDFKSKAVAIAGLLFCALSSTAWGLSKAGSEIESYGKRLPATFVANTIAYKSTEQTMSEPLVAYMVLFTTSDPSFMSNPRAVSDKAAFAENTGKRLILERKFCTNELKSIMHSARINVVSGEIKSRDGRHQFTVMCTRD